MLTPRNILEALIDRFIPIIRKAFLAAIQDVADNAILNAMITAIEAGDVEAAFRAVGFSEAALRPLTREIETAFEQGGVLTGRSFPNVLNTPTGKAVFRFDVRNSRAEAWLRDHTLELTGKITDDARISVQNTLVAGMQAGDNPRRVALDIVGRVGQDGKRQGGIIGLAPNQEQWVRSARNKLENLDSAYFQMELRDKRFDNTVIKAIRDGKPLSRDTIDKLISRYKSNALKWRGDNIARTEAIASLNRSEYEATMQAVDTGAVDRSAVRKIWDDTGDNRTRFTHRKMRGQSVGLDEPFVSPSGAKMMHPGDTSLKAPMSEIAQCRCRARYDIDWLAGLD